VLHSSVGRRARTVRSIARKFEDWRHHRCRAAEFQITHKTIVTGWANFVTNVVDRGFGWNAGQIQSTHAPEIALAGQGNQLLARLNTLLMAGQPDAGCGTTRQ